MISSDKNKEVRKLLKMLHNTIPEIKGSIVMNYSGKLIADSLPEDVNSERIRISVRNYTAATHRYLDELDKMEMIEQIINKYADGYIVIFRENQSLIMVTTTKDIRLGLILGDLRRTSEKIDEIVRS